MITVGDKLDGKYVVVRKLGGGGFGEVFLATDVALPDRKVAIKVLTRKAAGDHSDMIREMQALSKLNHPGVVAFYHYFIHADHIFLVMEYCAGGSLHDEIERDGKFDETEVFEWALTLCETLAVVHESDIVHHDIKPLNILFTETLDIKLGDFGVANRDMGTIIYMPPEMFLGERVTTDPRVDVYALGITLLETLTGNNPFIDLKADEQLPARIAHDFIPRTLPRWIQEVLLKATHPTPELRFQSMNDFAEAIRAKRVPYVFDGKRIKAHALAQKVEAHLARRKWRSAATLVTNALELSPDCIAALLAAGRLKLMTQQIKKAEEYFSTAAKLSARTAVQKELGWINLEKGWLPAAISMLTDHLQRNSSDYEAYNLLLKCFFLSGRYEAGTELTRTLINEKAPNDCFRSNAFLCRLLNGEYSTDELKKIDRRGLASPFVAYNLMVATETPRAWGDQGPALKSKVIFEEYRFGISHRSGKKNAVEVTVGSGKRREFADPIVTVGSMAANDIVLNDASVSRRHAVLVNFPDEVWIYDLGSAKGVEVEGQKVAGRMFLDGVHEVRVGKVALRVGAKAGLLV